MANLALQNIQGNILGGFNKDFQTFAFLQFRNAAAGRAWVAEIADGHNQLGVAKSSSEDVLKFNAQFKALKAEGKNPERFIEVAWTNLAISFQGLTALNINAADLAKFPQAKILLADIAPEMLKLAQERLARVDGGIDPRLSYVLLDHGQDPIPGRFDAIVSALSIHHL